PTLMNNKIWTTLFFIFCFFFCSRFAFGQQGVISYKVKSHGKVVKRDHPIQLVVNNNIAYLVTKNNNKTQKFINFSKRAIFETIHTRGKYFTQKKLLIHSSNSNSLKIPLQLQDFYVIKRILSF